MSKDIELIRNALSALGHLPALKALDRVGEMVALYSELVGAVEVDLTSTSDNAESFMTLGNVNSTTLVALGLITQEDVDRNKKHYLNYEGKQYEL